MRKISYLISGLLLTLTGFTSCNEDPVDSAEQINNVAWIKVENITGGVLEMKQDDQFIISVQMFPEEAADKGDYTFQFSSSNIQVATVSKDGTVTAVGSGVATINVIPSHNEKLAYSFKAKVKAKPAILVSQEIKDGIFIEIDEQAQEHQAYDLAAKLNVVPDDASDKTLIYSIDDNQIATIDGEGSISPVSVGSTVIRVTWNEENISVSIPLVIEAMKIGPLDRTGWIVTDLDEPDSKTAALLIDGTSEEFSLNNKLYKNATAEGVYATFCVNRTNTQPFFAIQLEQSKATKKTYATKFNLYGSNDGENWTIIKSGITADSTDDLDEIQLGQNITSQYLKFEITAVKSDKKSIVIQELNLIGYKD